MDRVQQVLQSLTADKRGDYLFDTKTAAAAVECVPTKFADWWYRTKRKLKALYKVQPGQLAAEFAALLAEAEMERQQEVEAENNRVA